MIFYIFMIIFSPFTAVIPMVHALYLIYKRKIKVEKNYWNISLLALFIWALVVAFLNNSLISLGGAFMLLGYWAISVISQSYFNTRQKVNEALKFLSYCTALAAINGIVEKVTFMFLGKPQHRIFSTFGNPNMTGAWFASSIFIILYLKKTKLKKNEGRLLNGIIMLSAIALLLTESSGAFVAFGGAMVIYLLLDKVKSKKTLAIILIGGSVFLGMFVFMQKNSNSAGVINELSVSFNSRVDIWQGSVEMIKEKPLTGWGMLGTLEHGVDYFPRNGNSIHSHNLWLSVFVSLGVVGLVTYIFMKFRLFKNVFKLYNRREPMVPMIIALNLMVIIQGLVDFSLYSPQLGIMFMVTASITVNLAEGRISNKRKPKSEKVIPFEIKSMAG